MLAVAEVVAVQGCEALDSAAIAAAAEARLRTRPPITMIEVIVTIAARTRTRPQAPDAAIMVVTKAGEVVNQKEDAVVIEDPQPPQVPNKTSKNLETTVTTVSCVVNRNLFFIRLKINAIV